MNDDNPISNLKVKEELADETPENLFIPDINLQEEVEFCAVQNIKEEIPSTHEIKPELTEFDYNLQTESNDDAAIPVTDSLSLLKCDTANQIEKHESRDDDNKEMSMEEFIQYYKQGASLSGQKSIQGHSKTDNKKVYKCDICDKYLSHSDGLRIHLKRHKGIKNYKCNICLKYFVSSSTLNTHLLVHKDKKYECDICRNKFTQKSSVRSHITEVHINTKKFKCKVCKKQFSRRNTLKKHMVTHGSSSEYQCQLCNKYFGSLQHMNVHLATHVDVKTFQCNICDKYFADNEYLNRHKQVHKNNKYKCDTCEKTYRRKDYLSMHMNIHNFGL